MEEKLITETSLQSILDKSIEKCVNDLKQHFEDTIIKKFNSANSIRQKIDIVLEFAESVNYDYSNDF
jgi:hypothetical protein